MKIYARVRMSPGLDNHYYDIQAFALDNAGEPVLTSDGNVVAVVAYGTLLHADSPASLQSGAASAVRAVFGATLLTSIYWTVEYNLT